MGVKVVDEPLQIVLSGNPRRDGVIRGKTQQQAAARPSCRQQVPDQAPRGERECPADWLQAALEIIGSRGLPNYFGSQRYGALGNSAAIGIRLLQGDPEGAVRALVGNPEEISDERWRSGVQAFHDGDLASAVELLPPHCRTEKEVIKVAAAPPGRMGKRGEKHSPQNHQPLSFRCPVLAV